MRNSFQSTCVVTSDKTTIPHFNYDCKWLRELLTFYSAFVMLVWDLVPHQNCCTSLLFSKQTVSISLWLAQPKSTHVYYSYAARWIYKSADESSNGTVNIQKWNLLTSSTCSINHTTLHQLVQHTTSWHNGDNIQNATTCPV